MDIIIWTKFDKEPIALRAFDTQEAWKFEERILFKEGNYVHLRAVDGDHVIRREHIVRMHIPLQEEGSDDNGTV